MYDVQQQGAVENRNGFDVNKTGDFNNVTSCTYANVAGAGEMWTNRGQTLPSKPSVRCLPLRRLPSAKIRRAAYSIIFMCTETKRIKPYKLSDDGIVA